ncbi:unnamed protein product [Cuscuta europaea]|uniref:AMMECR1 domain-containing protein n=1 Tax=Cuscuta europaea TaxID=41803 RepID=A0A9P0ZTD1_CUSEU|nr:unnamed protein product [Cuscuta europaea]
MVSANREMAVYCFDTLVAHYNREKPPPPAFDDGDHPLFVTWKKVENGGEPSLRGCIGTLKPYNLIEGFKNFSLASALEDRRFGPIQAKELPTLECTVSVLANYETGRDYLDWEVGKHGITIEFTDLNNTKRSATYLPEVAAHGGWTQGQTVISLMRKAGYNGPITDSILDDIQLTRYQSTIFTLTYSDYVDFVKTTRSATPSIK